MIAPTGADVALAGALHVIDAVSTRLLAQTSQVRPAQPSEQLQALLATVAVHTPWAEHSAHAW